MHLRAAIVDDDELLRTYPLRKWCSPGDADADSAADAARWEVASDAETASDGSASAYLSEQDDEHDEHDADEEEDVCTCGEAHCKEAQQQAVWRVEALDAQFAAVAYLHRASSDDGDLDEEKERATPGFHTLVRCERELGCSHAHAAAWHAAG
jgi:hypothetical protein